MKLRKVILQKQKSHKAIQGPIVAAATVPPYGNKKQRLACPFTQTPNSSCIETDHEEAVDCREWPLSE